MATRYKQDADELATTKKRRDIHKIWAEYKGRPKKEAVANMNLVSAQFVKYQTPPRMRNICYIALYSIPTNKCSRTPSNSTGIPE
jgi:hypothetical protein